MMRWRTTKLLRRADGLRRLGGVVLFLLTAMPVASGADSPIAELDEAVVKIVETSEAAVVSIARIVPGSPEEFGKLHKPLGLPRQEQRRSEFDILPNEFGTGFLISPPKSAERFVLTNYHVVRGGPVAPAFESGEKTELRIQFADRRGCHAAIIAADPRSDLAVLKLDWEKSHLRPTDFPTMNWEVGAAPRKGQFVILLGNPHAIARDGSASVSWGLVSNLTRQPVTFNRVTNQEDLAASSMLYRLGTVMQLDARMNLGTSGGPVLNLKGELVGIGTSLAAIEGYDQSVGFAIPIEPLTRRIIRTLLAGQEVEYGMLGIGPTEYDAERFLSLNTGLPQRSAAAVATVHPGSPASQAGIRQGDVIVSVENVPVQSVADLMRLVGLHPPEAEITLSIWRFNGDKLPSSSETVKVRLGKWAVQDADGIIETNPRFAPWRGLTVDYPTARSQQLGHSFDFNRVMVTRVAAGSSAEAAKLERGNFITHVNNVPVRTPSQFFAEVAKLSGNVSLRMADETGESRRGKIISVRE